MAEIALATPDFDRIMRDTGVANADAIRVIWLLLQDEINRRERLQQTVGGTAGHNLLSTTHPDTLPADPIEGDLIQALGATPTDTTKYWLNGKMVMFPSANNGTGAAKYWINGKMFGQGGFSAASGSGTKWQRFPVGTVGQVPVSNGTFVEWGNIAASGISAAVYRINAFSVTAGSDTAVTFEAVNWDGGGFWSAGDPTKLTIPTGQGGRYLLVGQIEWLAGVASYRAKVRQGGTTVLGTGGSSELIGLQNLPNQVAVLATLAEGDYVELVASWSYSDSVPRPVVGGSGSTFLQILKVG